MRRNFALLSDAPASMPEAPRHFENKLTALKTARDRQRAEAIRDIADAFRCLHDNVFRFVLVLAGAPANTQQPEAAIEPSEHRCLDSLLSSLLARATHGKFRRMHELSQAVQNARSAEQCRDIIFSHASLGDGAALRQAAAELQRLDAIFADLCVAHILENHPGSVLSNDPFREVSDGTSAIQVGTAAGPARRTR